MKIIFNCKKVRLPIFFQWNHLIVPAKQGCFFLYLFFFELFSVKKTSLKNITNNVSLSFVDDNKSK